MGITAFICTKSVCLSSKIYVCLCLYAHMYLQWPYPIELELQIVVSHQPWVLGPNSSPLKGQQVFLTPELSPPAIPVFLLVCLSHIYLMQLVICLNLGSTFICSRFLCTPFLSPPSFEAILSTLKVLILFICFLTLSLSFCRVSFPDFYRDCNTHFQSS